MIAEGTPLHGTLVSIKIGSLAIVGAESLATRNVPTGAAVMGDAVMICGREG